MLWRSNTSLRSRWLARAILMLASLAPLGLAAQEHGGARRVPSSPTELRLSYAPVVQRAAPAVVNVYAAKTVAVRNPLFDDPIFRRFFGVPGAPGGQGESVQRSLGSGVLVDPAGLIVTNNHVIEGADQVKVSLADKREFEADMVLKDSRSDLAVLRIRAQNERFPALELADSDALEVGDVVLAIGNPFAVGQAVTPEIAEGLGLKRPSGTLIASVTPTSPAARAGLKTSDLIVAIDGQPVEDANAFDYRFATKPIGGTARLGIVRAGKELTLNVALEAAPDTPHEELVIASPSPFQGAKVSNLSPALADRLRLDPSAQGVVILEIANGSPAQSLGFQPGDLVLSVNN